MTSIEPLLTPIRERLTNATPGPWYVDDQEQTVRAREYAGEIVFDRSVECRSEWVENFKSTAVFIASAPADVARLLAAVEAVLKLTDEAERLAKCACHSYGVSPDQIRAAVTTALGGEK